MDSQFRRKYQRSQVAVVLSLAFALAGFSYNVWRMEVSESNNTTRTACFEILMNLSKLEQLVYAAHYDRDESEGNPRKGWVLVGLIADLSELTDTDVREETVNLKAAWSANWSNLATDRPAADNVVNAIDAVRNKIKVLLRSLN
ncbi:hypothetical protein [Litorivivens sp.]|uniref:hypothetical protein n=1 Tax=Litorivivens sp. TaxID=2020868 RepID=UPI0035627E69